MIHEMLKIAVRIEMSVQCYYSFHSSWKYPPFKSYNQMNGFNTIYQYLKSLKNTGFSFSISMAKMRILK